MLYWESVRLRVTQRVLAAIREISDKEQESKISMSKNINIIFTSDTHGHVLPVSYATGKKEDGGLLCIAQEIHKDENTLVIDGGDSLQGTPLVQYYLENGWSKIQEDTAAKAEGIHPVAAAFNAMKLDYYTLGNHDFNFGYDKIVDYTKQMKATLLAANVEDLGGELTIRKSAVHTLGNGLRVGLTGVVTDWVNIWEKPANLTKLKVTDPYAAAKEALEELKNKENCDITICIYHGGFEKDLESGRLLSETSENIACKIGEELGYDILLTGHQHMPVESVILGKTFSCQPPDKALRYIKMSAEVMQDVDDHKANVDASAVGVDNTGKTNADNSDTEKVICGKLAISSQLVTAGGQPEASTFEALQPLEKAVQTWLDQPAGAFEEDIVPEPKLEAALYGSKVARLFNQVQLRWTNADISCTSLGNDPIGFMKIVSIRDIYVAYPFANISVVKKITGKVLKEALEHCASYFKLEDGQPGIAEYFLKPKIEHYNFDFYAGLDYAFDIRKPVGERVVRLNRLDGTAIGEDEELTLVTSDYRATGTGGYGMIGECPAIWTGADNVQDQLVEYIRSTKPLLIPDNTKYEVIWK